MPVTNRQIVLRQRPHGLVGATDTESVTTEAPPVADGGWKSGAAPKPPPSPPSPPIPPSPGAR